MLSTQLKPNNHFLWFKPSTFDHNSTLIPYLFPGWRLECQCAAVQLRLIKYSSYVCIVLVDVSFSACFFLKTIQNDTYFIYYPSLSFFSHMHMWTWWIALMLHTWPLDGHIAYRIMVLRNPSLTGAIHCFGWDGHTPTHTQTNRHRNTSDSRPTQWE